LISRGFFISDFIDNFLCTTTQLELVAQQYLLWIRMGGSRRKLTGLVPSADLRFIERLEGEMVA
jgi:hypothetical protein